MSTKREIDAPLRRIAVYVDEPEPGWFSWALAEADEGATNWAQIESSDEWMGTYKEAMAAGLLVLQQMINDLDSGPRNKPPASAKKPSNFGFGFGFGFGTNLP
ncbi:hypothetical protein J2W28_000971 [Variovorax boronicumulans]|uniref:hypothetical protein n=1 Tax=Variovorax boronicumulans TaxID=436515 RepID=UPI0027842CB3|nr:hypothetical protein [Variovorax boronicumulans]MDP9991943.1 hypothetical protein [Variovorax boronicumulans]MDQ0001838.1 hypothetical protein [Variovorax boronicumulans]